jgi:hypothetical protein
MPVWHSRPPPEILTAKIAKGRDGLVMGEADFRSRELPPRQEHRNGANTYPASTKTATRSMI